MRIFSKTIVGCVLAVGLGANANAADVAKARPMAVAPVYSWNGFYAGVNAGYSWGKADTDYTLAGAALASDSVSPSGFIGGGQIGYNWQTGSTVFGLEADFQGSAQEDNTTVAFTVGGVALSTAYTASVDWFGTVRGRLGYAAGGWMPYLTGGWAYASVKTEGTSTGGGFTTPFSESEVRNGWTLGAGVEAAFGSNWTWKAEYLYLDFGTITDSTATPGGTFASSTDVTDHIGRLGVNYRF